MCYSQSSEARWERDKLYSWMEGVAPTITRLHKGDAEIEKQESCYSLSIHLREIEKTKSMKLVRPLLNMGMLLPVPWLVFVSQSCLHPLDTVKTMIQSCASKEDKSLCYTGRSIISERGGKRLLG
ncbi:hypothetical protein HID58_006470 [Brassica napus]|uniref:Uncharacterized protein n=1 Tax=Brassica napus TaxID=3708 RepID=A0ABQ8EBL1_BRANA|nr:hypothetical protein HID58_006470 [Brassica napus]